MVTRACSQVVDKNRADTDLLLFVPLGPCHQDLADAVRYFPRQDSQTHSDPKKSFCTERPFSKNGNPNSLRYEVLASNRLDDSMGFLFAECDSLLLDTSVSSF
jgi:hypothetical protein